MKRRWPLQRNSCRLRSRSTIRIKSAKPPTVRDAETALNIARAAVKQTQADIAGCNKELKTAQSEWTKTGKSLESFGKSCDNVSKNLNKAGKLLSTTLTTPIVALGTAALKSSIDFESSFNSDNAKQQSDSSNSNQHWHHQNAKCSASNNQQNANDNQGCSCWFFRFCYSIHMEADYRFKLRQRRRQAISFAFFSIQPRSDSLSSRLVLSDTPMLA